MKAFFLGKLGDLGFGVWTCLHDGAVNIIGDGWDSDIRDCQNILLAELAKTRGHELTIEWRGQQWVAERIGAKGWGIRLESAGDAAKLELAFLRDLAVMAAKEGEQ